MRSNEAVAGLDSTPELTKSDSLPAPVARVVAIAQSDPTPIAADFQPTESHRALASALTAEGIGTIAELAEKAGVARSTVYRVFEDRDAIKWIVSHSAGLMSSALPAVHSHLLHKALNDKGVAALKLFLLRFDPDFKPQTQSISGENIQVNQFGSYSLDELERLASLKRVVLGSGGKAQDPGNHEGAQK